MLLNLPNQGLSNQERIVRRLRKAIKIFRGGETQSSKSSIDPAETRRRSGEAEAKLLTSRPMKKGQGKITPSASKAVIKALQATIPARDDLASHPPATTDVGAPQEPKGSPGHLAMEKSMLLDEEGGVEGTKGEIVRCLGYFVMGLRRRRESPLLLKCPRMSGLKVWSC